MTYSVRCPACYSPDATYDPRDRVIECQSKDCTYMRWKFGNSAALLFDDMIKKQKEDITWPTDALSATLPVG